MREAGPRIHEYRARLDAAPARRPAIDLRTEPRYAYRAERLSFEVALSDEETLATQFTARNLSGQGVGGLTSRFVFPGARCTLALEKRHGGTERVEGKITRCRYLIGSASVYDVGVRLTRPIDAALFAPDARQTDVLLACGEPDLRAVLAEFLQARGARLAWAEDVLEAAALALEREFDLILVDLDEAGGDALATTNALRTKGYLQPIIGLTVHPGAEHRARCAAAGLTGYLTKPVTREVLAELLTTLHTEPLVSTLAADAALAPPINRFVDGLRQRARALVVALQLGNRSELLALALALRGEAGSFGFEPISIEAEHLQSLLALEAPPERLRPAVEDLVHTCLAARPVVGPDGFGSGFQGLRHSEEGRDEESRRGRW